MTCTCKVFSTLILDSRYFYSQKKKNVSSCCLMLRDSCLYSSLACSVYSICWVIFFLSSFEITCRYLFIIWHNSHSVICSAEYYLCTFFFFFGFTKGGGFNSRWMNLREEKLSFGWLAIVCKSLNVTCSEWSFVEVTALFRNADVAATSSGLWFLDIMAESAVSTVVFPDGVRSCMVTPIFFIFIVYLWFSGLTYVLTDKSYAIISISGVVRPHNVNTTPKTSRLCWVQLPAF